MTNLKNIIKKKATSLGAQLVGFTNLSRYRKYFPDAPNIFHPDQIWPEAKSVIVMGLPLPLPIVESTPSINYQELYNTSNITLDQMAYQVSIELIKRGYAAISLPRDGYSNLSYLINRASSSFSHVIAGYLSGLGTLGWNHNLLTPSFGSRVRLVSVLTSAILTPDRVITRDLCLHCDLCQKLCPVKALKGDCKAPFAILDYNKCTRRHQKLKESGCWPCGICTKVCPIGQDRKLFNRTKISLYLDETNGKTRAEIVAWNHIRKFGSSLNIK